MTGRSDWTHEYDDRQIAKLLRSIVDDIDHGVSLTPSDAALLDEAADRLEGR